MRALRVMGGLVLALLSLGLIVWLRRLADSNPYLDSPAATRAWLAGVGLLSALLLGASVFLVAGAFSHRSKQPEIGRLFRVFSAILAFLGGVLTAAAWLLIAVAESLENWNSNAAYDYTGPERTGPGGVWVWLIPVALVFAVLFIWLPRVSAWGELAVVLLGFAAILAHDEVRPAASATVWSVASVPLVAAAVLGLLALSADRALEVATHEAEMVANGS